MTPALDDNNWLCSKIEAAMGRPVASVGPLSGGCVGEVYLAQLEDGLCCAIKVDRSREPVLSIEARMLDDLTRLTPLPVPKVYASTDRLLVMEHIANDGQLGPEGEVCAANVLAEIHAISPTDQSGCFGYDYDTLIGGLIQPNPWCKSWIEFFAQHRLGEMSRQAASAGRLSQQDLLRIDRLCDKLDHLLTEPNRPALIHGDVWSGNVLSRSGRITAFIDPALYFAHHEIELAFIQLFGTFGTRFFEAYAERHPIDDGFFDERCDLYNLYPLLVHVRLFGGDYVQKVQRTLRRYGV